MNGIKKTCEDNGVRYGTVISAIGSLRKLTYQVLIPDDKAKMGASYNEPQTVPGPIEVLGIQGVIFQSEEGQTLLHLHGSFCNKDGKFFGGHVVQGDNPVLATLDAVIGEVTNARMIARYDKEIEGNLFNPEPS
jgi:predicted DNA-binding protein with PD1-like motif